MAISSRTLSPQRIVYFGMRCAFSEPPLKALIDGGHEIAGVVLPGLPLGPPIVSQPVIPTIRLSPADEQTLAIEALARRASAPVLSVGDVRHPSVVSAINQLAPDLIAVACFPWLLPREILKLPRLGGFNVHPSLLPHGRGPEPLFWSFRRGEHETGVTIHLLDERFDAGPILLQERVPIPDGTRLPDLELQLAELGGGLLLQAIDKLSHGSIQPQPQNDAEMTSAPIPCQADFTVPTDLPARWAFNFVRAVAPTTDCLKVVVMATKDEIAIVDALAFREIETPDVPVEFQESRVVIGFLPGTVTFSLLQTG